jgi:tetratricopeptide (TPR) repeat protein
VAAGVKAFDAGRFADARAAFEAASKKNPNDFGALYNLGMTCEKLGDSAAAETAYKAALAVRPNLEAASAELCAMYLDAGRVDEAVAVSRAALAQHPKGAAVHENAGVALAAHGDVDEGLSELERALAIAPREASFELTLAHWLTLAHRPGAAGHLQSALRLAGGDYGMLLAVGLEQRLAGDLGACVKTFGDAIAARDGGEARTERALCRLGQKDESGALEDLKAAVKVEPEYPQAHYYLGGRLATGGHFKEAEAEYSAYLKLAPSGSLAKAATERLKAVRQAQHR